MARDPAKTPESAGLRLEELPSPPSGLAEIIRSAATPDMSLQRIAAIVSQEPGFTIELLRVANSPVYGFPKKLRTVQHATVALGIRAVRNLAIAHAVRILSRDWNTGSFARRQFWEDSLRRALSCRLLAEEAGMPDPMEAFTIGLIQDIAVLVMALQWPDQAAALQEASRMPAAERMAKERELTGHDHASLFQELAEVWGLPQDFITTVAHHHSADDTELSTLAKVCRAGDALADVFQARGAGQCLPHARELIERLIPGSKTTLEEHCSRLRDEMGVASRDLRIRIDRQPTWKDLMAQANMQLVQINEDYEQLTQRLESLLREKEELTRRLEAANSELRRLATTDPLTNVANRRHFTDALRESLDECTQQGTPCTLLLLDVDHFKNINDSHGHAIGDDVLKAIADRISRSVRDVDLVGRIGGEEFAILLPDTVEMHGMEVAERLRRSLADAPLTCPNGLVLNISASFGGTTTQPGIVVPNADQFLSQADRAMYHAKYGGRNRLSWNRSSGIAPVSGWH